jgi:hypothetical protein
VDLAKKAAWCETVGTFKNGIDFAGGILPFESRQPTRLQLQPARHKVSLIRPRMQQTRLTRGPKLLPLLEWRTRLRSELSINAARSWMTTRPNRRMMFSLTAIQRS